MTTRNAALKVQLLGRVTAATPGGEKSFSADKRHQLLGYLACYCDWVSRDRLADLFWSDTTTETARQNLRKLLARTQKLPWQTGLEIERQRVRWHVETDLAEFWRAVEADDLERAVTLYQGPLLRGMDSYEDGEFADWLEVERGRAHSRWREALLRHAAGERPEKAASLYLRLLEQDEFDEEALALHLAALAQSGRKQDALKAYRAFAANLERELGLVPSSATQQLAEAVERSDVPPRAWLPAVAATAGDEIVNQPASFPAPMTSFIGRDLELGEVANLLSRPDCRLLTLVGPGGVGKTRLALQAATELATRYGDGVYFVALEAIISPEVMPTTIAEALGVTLQGQVEPIEEVSRLIGERCLLLVLDNFEQLAEGSPMISDLIRSCRRLNVLVTSRERLNLEEEWSLAVNGLTFPLETSGIEDVEVFDAVSLFVERAQRVSPLYHLGSRDTAAVLKICRLLEGYPLGIELAAAWVRMMSCTDIATEIERSLDFLASSSRNVSERHRSTRAVFEHSWALLASTEQTTLTRLSVFRGGFTKEAANSVAGANITLLAALVDKSLLRTSADGRYDFHPLVRYYAQEKLQHEPIGQAEVRKRHGVYYLRLVQQAESPQELTYRRLVPPIDVDLDNVRAAWQWAVSGKEVKELQQTSMSLVTCLEVRALYEEGYTLFSQAVSQLNEPEPNQHGALGHVLAGQATFLYRLGQYEQATRVAERSLVLLQPLEATLGVVKSLKTLGSCAWRGGHYQNSKRLYEKALSIAQVEQDATEVASVLSLLGVIEQYLGNREAAKAHFQHSLDLYRKQDDRRGTVTCLSHLGNLVRMIGNAEGAEHLLEEGLVLARQIGFRGALPSLLHNLGVTASKLGNYGKAKALYAEALQIAQKGGDKTSETVHLMGLGRVALLAAEHTRARSHFMEALKIAWEIRFMPEVVEALIGLARVLAVEGQTKKAVVFANVALNHVSTAPEDKRWAQELLNDLQDRISPDDMLKAEELGKSTELAQLVKSLLV